MRRHGYTLVEVLAVTVLLGLIASLSVPPLLRAMSRDPLSHAADQLAHAFRDLRAQAYGHHISLELETWGFSAVSIDDGVRTALPTARLPDAVQVSWTRNGRTTRALDLSARGHGLNTEVTLQRDNRDLSFTIDGLTGTWTRKAAP